MVSCEIKKGGRKFVYNEWLGWGVFNDSMSQLHSAEFVIAFGRKVAIISILGNMVKCNPITRRKLLNLEIITQFHNNRMIILSINIWTRLVNRDY